MRLEQYHYEKDSQGWRFSELTVRRLNLFVGATGSGKSRLLNTISSAGEFISSGETFKSGTWTMRFRDSDRTYAWHCDSVDSGGDKSIESETLSISTKNGAESAIYSRRGAEFVYNGAKLPKLSSTTPGLYLFREEEAVAPLYEWFTNIRRRNFFGEDLVQSCAFQSIPQNVEPADKVQQRKGRPPGIGLEIRVPLSLNVRLSLLKRTSPQKFFDIVNLYRAVFPNIEKCDVVDATELKINLPIPDKGKTPVFVIKEKHVEKQVSLPEMSSGMQKVLLIICDVLSLGKSGTYLIDEYENSLGVNAIGFLPELLLEYGMDNQFFITSHHPYLINNIPVDDWHIFHRKGSTVTIRTGKEFAAKFGASKQQAFTQLINDPFYSEGVE